MRESLGQGATEVDVIPHGVQTERFSAVPRDVARRVMGLPEDALVVGFASSPSRRVKDHALFRAAIAGLPDAMGVALGAVTPELMPTWLSSLDVLLLTSRSEGSPVITKEALCVGTRVVSVDVGDVRDQLEAMSGCAVVESRNPRDLADATRRCLRLPPPDAQEARRRFDVAREAKSVAEVYRRVVGSA
jgi:glycosyltransferase involved in cell wall biosynthesis